MTTTTLIVLCAVFLPGVAVGVLAHIEGRRTRRAKQ